MGGRVRRVLGSVDPAVPIAIAVQTVVTALACAAGQGSWMWGAVLGLGAAAAAVLAWRMQVSAVAPVTDLRRRLAAVADAPIGASPVPESGPRGPLEHAVADLHRRVTRSLEETRRHREAAQDAGVYKTAFLKAVSHELRTPLNAILGFTDVLLSGLEGSLSEGRRENLEVIRDAGQRLLEIFNDCIELSAMASGQLSLRRERVEVTALLDEVVELLAQKRGLKPVHLRVAAPEARLVLSVQRDRLLRVLQTLGEYALSRTEAGAVSLVADLRPPVTGASQPMVVITVEDGGGPEAPGDLEALFRPELATDVGQRRTRLRLSIARQLVELHDGKLELIAGQPGRTFAVHLPAQDEGDHA